MEMSWQLIELRHNHLRPKIYEASDIYCDVFFDQIYTNPDGNYRFCCHASPVPSEHRMNSKTHTPFEWYKSDYMEEARNNIFDGIKNSGCETCYKMEERGGKSWRQIRHNQKTHTDIKEVKLNLALSNACNLSCYMCGPENSTTKQVEMNNVFGKGSLEANTDFPGFALKRKNYERLKANILENIAEVKYINLIGGEPLMIPEVWDLLDSISDKDAKRIHLCWITNMTKVGYKNYSLEDVIEKYERVRFNISCDHFGEKESWMRYPIDIPSFENNLVTYHNYIMQIQVTVGILNGSDLIEIKEYYTKKFNLPVDFTNLVTPGTRGLSIAYYPREHKEMLINKYKHDSCFDLVVELLKVSLDMNEDDIKLQYSKDLDYCQKLSDYRKFQFKDIWKNTLPGI
jgi:MoaA/NifB/PqqE/SkfB family radical SAM enzyme